LNNTELDNAICPDAEVYFWDAVIVGTGMGGGTVGYELARAGKKVLFIEKGNLFASSMLPKKSYANLSCHLDDDAKERLGKGFWPNRFTVETNFGSSKMHLPLGCGSGGSTSLYAGHLERFFPTDFTPKKNFPHITNSNLPDRWPITFEELLPFYKKAESLYRVRGTKDGLDNYQDSDLLQPPNLLKRGKYLHESFNNSGLDAYQSHVACDFMEGCTECGNELCKRNCKNDANKICVIPSLINFGAKILPNCTVNKIIANKSEVSSIECSRGGRTFYIKSKVFILAAGSLSTPIILLKSANDIWPNGLANSSGYVGRNLMFHASDFVAVTSKIINSYNEQKTISSNSLYQVGDLKLGTIQSTGILIDKKYIQSKLNKILYQNKFLLSFLQPIISLTSIILEFIFRRIALFSIIVEDLPYLENYVYVKRENPNETVINYRYTNDLKSRSNYLYREFKNSLNGKHLVFRLPSRINLNFGHSCGTCRFGDDPKTSVLNSDNRAHDLSNLWVCDASFFPSAAGTNPSLTIAANAIRVAEKIAAHLDG
jgi:choline dehydrogenase-like flavoprotein